MATNEAVKNQLAQKSNGVAKKAVTPEQTLNALKVSASLKFWLDPDIRFINN